MNTDSDGPTESGIVYFMSDKAYSPVLQLEARPRGGGNRCFYAGQSSLLVAGPLPGVILICNLGILSTDNYLFASST